MNRAFIFTVSCMTCCYLYGTCNSTNLEDIKHEAQDKLESCFENTAIGALEVGLGFWRATKGDVVGAAAVAVDGFNRIKQGVHEFQESKELFDRKRETEIKQHETPESNTGPWDREY